MKRTIFLILTLLLTATNGYSADQKVTSLDSITPTSTDVIYIIDDPGGTPLSKKVAVSSLLTDALIPDTITIDLAATSTALAANGANCSAGSAPLGVNASGAAESCFDVWTEAENTSASYISAETNSLETTVTGIADTEIFVGDGADSGAFVTVSGDATLANTGALTIADDKIGTAELNDGADTPSEGQCVKVASGGSTFEYDTCSGAASAGGSNTQVQYNSSGTLTGDGGFKYNATTDTLTAYGGLQAGDGTDKDTTFITIDRASTNPTIAWDNTNEEFDFNYPINVGGSSNVLTIENQGEIRFEENNGTGTNYSGFKANSSVTTDTIWILPFEDGTDGQVLSTNGANKLTFVDASSGSGDITQVWGCTTGDCSTITGTGGDSLNAGAADDLEIPNGTGPTIDTTGQIAVDTTDDDFIYYGASAARILTYKLWDSKTLENPTTGDSFLLWQTLDAITLTNIKCISDPTQAGDSVSIDIQECDSAGANCVDADTSAITCDYDGAADDGTINDPNIDANDYINWKINSAVGTPSQVNVTIYYTKDAE